MRTRGATLLAALFVALAGLLAVLGMRQEAVSALRATVGPPLGAPEACARNAGLPTGFGREPLAGIVGCFRHKIHGASTGWTRAVANSEAL